MTWLKPSWQSVLAIVLCLIAVALGAMSKPEAAALADPTASVNYPYLGTKGLMFALAIAAALISMVRIPPLAEAVVLFVGAHLVAWLLISGIAGFEGTALARTSCCWPPHGCLAGAAWRCFQRCARW